MPKMPIVVAAGSLPSSALLLCRRMATELANMLGQPVGLAVLGDSSHEAIADVLGGEDGRGPLETIDPVSGAGMSAAPMVWTADGRPDWGTMWETFCELALYGGPPHRGPEAALTSPGSFDTAAEHTGDAIEEMRRGILATTGLVAVEAEPGWIAVGCDSTRMAAWLCATIILENVDARCSEERLYLPASRAFALKDQVKSVVTVLAKTNHYWKWHAAGL